MWESDAFLEQVGKDGDDEAVEEKVLETSE